MNKRFVLCFIYELLIFVDNLEKIYYHMIIYYH